MEGEIRVLFLWEWKGVVVQLPIEDRKRETLNVKVVASNSYDALVAARYEASKRGKVVRGGVFSVIDVAKVYRLGVAPYASKIYKNDVRLKAFDHFLGSLEGVDAVNFPGEDFDKLHFEFVNSLKP